MVRVTTSAPSLKPLMRALRAEADRKKADAVLALVEAVNEGTLSLQDFLEEAVTKTGLQRENEGGFPGRHRSGNMVGSISNNTHMPEYDGRKTVMAFGWFAGEFEHYFLEQDQGIQGMIPAANAMPQAADRAIQMMHELMLQWEKGTLDVHDD